MRVAIINNGVVENVCEASQEWADANGGIITDVAGIGWSYNGSTFAPPEIIPPTLAELSKTFTDAVQAHLDATARARNYDGILSACSYATSTHLPFSTEGQASVNWRDAVWLYCYSELAKVQAGTRSIPESTESFINELPVMTWTI